MVYESRFLPGGAGTPTPPATMPPLKLPVASGSLAGDIGAVLALYSVLVAISLPPFDILLLLKLDTNRLLFGVILVIRLASPAFVLNDILFPSDYLIDLIIKVSPVSR